MRSASALKSLEQLANRVLQQAANRFLAMAICDPFKEPKPCQAREVDVRL
jgi:hypothetical protein